MGANDQGLPVLLRYQTLQPINEVERFARGERPASCPTPRFCGASARLSARSMAIASSGWSYSGRELVEMRMGFRLRHRRVTRGLDRSRHLALPSVAHARLDPIYPSCQRINYRKAICVLATPEFSRQFRCQFLCRPHQIPLPSGSAKRIQDHDTKGFFDGGWRFFSAETDFFPAGSGKRGEPEPRLVFQVAIAVFSSYSGASAFSR